MSTSAADLISPLNKGLGLFDHDLTAAEITTQGWNLLREDLSLPAAVLYSEKLLHNQQWMRRFIEAYQVKLAPHGKTSMAPRLFQLQIEGGAWGITLATAHQVMVAYEHGTRRILMANQLIGKPNMAVISRLLSDPSFEFYCLIDSAAQVDQLAAFFSAQNQQLNVLIELGVENGRAGVRNDAQLSEVLAALDRHPGALRLCGIEVYEGVLDNEPAIREFLQRAVATTHRLLAENRFAQKPILTGAGSAWFDVVAEEFVRPTETCHPAETNHLAEICHPAETCPAETCHPERSEGPAFPLGHPEQNFIAAPDSALSANSAAFAEVILRPGCYLTHDAGNYRRAHQRMCQTNPVAHDLQPGLETALHIWAYVQSIPEPTRAIVGMGRRDAAFDSGLPVPALHYRPGREAPQPTPAHWEVTKLMDQHAYLRIDPADDLKVGDMLAFDICHPCLTFDKWRTIPILDTGYNVVDLAQTFF